MWKLTPTSTKNISAFLPVRLARAVCRTLSRRSTEAAQGPVLTLSNEASSLRGLKSSFFCLLRSSESQLTIAEDANGRNGKGQPTDRAVSKAQGSVRMYHRATCA